MKNRANKMYAGLIISSLTVSSVYADNAIKGAPYWSTPTRGVNLESKKTAKDNDESLLGIVGSSLRYSRMQIDNKFNAPDWFPNQHDKMPMIVKSGKAPKVWACASCHLASGSGHPESARLAGLDSLYLQSQMKAFTDGSRLDYSGHMNRMSKALSTAEIKEVSDWFSTLTPQKVTKVVETDQVLKTYVDETRMRRVAKPYVMEAMGNRIIEIPDNLAEVKKRHPDSTFISYVPIGSIDRGRNLVTTGGGKTIACAGCHGTDLKGSSIGPAIRGSFASYTVRQLYGFKANSRKGEQAAMMQTVVNGLTDKDIIDISAYLTSLPVN
jgi:cytochrome c553